MEVLVDPVVYVDTKNAWTARRKANEWFVFNSLCLIQLFSEHAVFLTAHFKA